MGIRMFRFPLPRHERIKNPIDEPVSNVSKDASIGPRVVPSHERVEDTPSVATTALIGVAAVDVPDVVGGVVGSGAGATLGCCIADFAAVDEVLDTPDGARGHTCCDQKQEAGREEKEAGRRLRERRSGECVECQEAG
jgi:hypothetical protein